MSERRILRAGVNGLPFEYKRVEYTTRDGIIYRLVEVDLLNGRPAWVHGYRYIDDYARMFSSRTMDELTAESAAMIERLVTPQPEIHPGGGETNDGGASDPRGQEG